MPRDSCHRCSPASARPEQLRHAPGLAAWASAGRHRVPGRWAPAALPARTAPQRHRIAFLAWPGRTGRLLRRLPCRRRPGCGRRPLRRPGPGGRGIPAGYRDHPDHRPARTCTGPRTRAGPGPGGRRADAVVGSRDDRCVPRRHYAPQSGPRPRQ